MQQGSAAGDFSVVYSGLREAEAVDFVAEIVGNSHKFSRVTFVARCRTNTRIKATSS